MSASAALSQPADEDGAGEGEEPSAVPAFDPAPRRSGIGMEAAALSLGARIDALLAGHAPLTDARVGIFVQDLGTGAVLYAREAGNSFNVASVTKVITMAASLALLGPDFRYRTAVLTDKIEGSVVTGNLYLQPRGNPTLSSADLELLSTHLERAGITQIRGELIVDAGYFDDAASPPHFDEQPEEQAAFRAPVGAANLERNAFTVRVRAARAGGQRAAVWIEPETSYVRLGRDEVITQSSGRDSVRVVSKLDDDGRMVVDVVGRVRAGSDTMGFRRRIEDPVAFAGETFRAVLAARGLRIRKPSRAGEVPSDARLLATVDSEPLSVMVQRLGKYSDNFVAETLLKTIAAEHRANADAAPPATWAEGVAAVERFLVDQVGLDDDAFRYENGSGLFDASGFSPAQVGAVLAAAQGDMRYGPELMSALAIAGVDGTLRGRMKRTDARGRVRAKTGTLAAVIALAGYIDAGPRAPAVFAIFVNDIEPRWIARTAARRLQDQVVEAVIEHLETVRPPAR
ncbi:D-alanyl-D-alanine carboxypeptidase/D-alanyl-D-alanine endopeptidase [Haliangium ochraceum]|uniref:D-alanyl-D-alaninecarboxypeptidase/D-alanyl-D-al anine-endopeptidase n=1 Tax=Haliangium ochraceum (strain DSM 14365 / JCM 11303 / SMP-2) TaxID=502025 RepID=D0LH25_HALO1|nr:D-alanyl-D-alanine carboxypeptidase/D-alanyl-D-alanine-endopeptidase [Haliangium ochraceum]ACY14747.1 D-alanyl-D-alaninecarboxypeptidase/D-alanyl-D-al anine-endopeptidase [Haliangium ochraceum DSM 14365]